MTISPHRLKHVTVAVDFSTPSRAAARVAYSIARAHDADLTLVHAYEPMAERHPAAATIMPAVVRDQLELGSKEHAIEKLHEIRDELEAATGGRGPMIWCELVDGLSGPAIARAALEAAADLLVIGSRGKSQVASWLVGSVACEVASRAHCPVLVVKDAPTNGWRGRFEAVTVGVDGGELSAPLVDAAKLLAADDGELTLVNAGLLKLGPELEKLRLELGGGDRVAIRVETGQPANALLRQASATSADLIAVGSHAREGLDNRLLGTTAERVLRGADVPVLMLPATSLPRARMAPTGDMAVFAELNGGECKTYLIASPTGEAMLVDPLFERVGAYVEELDRRELELRFVVDTHVHTDHLSGGPALTGRDGASYIVYETSLVSCECLRVRDGDKLGLGQLEARVMHTPGHSQDGLSLVFPDRVLTGDFLLLGECGAGRTDLPGGDAAEQWQALRRLADLDSALLVFPGHDYRGRQFSTLAEERVNNPRLKPHSLEDYVAAMNAERVGPSDWMAAVLRANHACAQATAEIPAHRASASELGGNGDLGIEIVPHISPASLAKALADDGVMVIDVREPGELIGTLGVIERAHRVPLSLLADQLESLGLAPDQKIVTVCRSGVRSEAAAAWLLAAGFTDVASLAGGMLAWKQQPATGARRGT